MGFISLHHSRRMHLHWILLGWTMSFPLDEKCVKPHPVHKAHHGKALDLAEKSMQWNTYNNFCDYCEQRGISELLKKQIKTHSFIQHPSYYWGWCATRGGQAHCFIPPRLTSLWCQTYTAWIKPDNELFKLFLFHIIVCADYDILLQAPKSKSASGYF